MHDCWKSHLDTPALGRQLCVALLLRELLFFEQKYKSVWASGFKALLYCALKLKKTIAAGAYGEPLKKSTALTLSPAL